MYTDLSFKISQLRAKNQNAMLTALAVMLAALFVTAVLPSLLVQYVYANQQLFTTPLLLEYIPVVSFGAGIITFLVAVIGNILRTKRIKFLETQWEIEGCDCCANQDEEVLAELESLAETLIKEEKKTPKKKSAKKKKITRKKSKTKK